MWYFLVFGWVKSSFNLFFLLEIFFVLRLKIFLCDFLMEVKIKDDVGIFCLKYLKCKEFWL